MPDNQFLRDTFKLHMPLGDELDLVFEVLSLDGSVITRALVQEIAATMVQYSLRGFTGIFNAMLRQGPGRRPIGIFLRIKSNKDMQAITPMST